MELEGDPVPLTEERGLSLDICAGVLGFIATPLLMGPVCLFSLGRFEEPVRICAWGPKMDRLDQIPTRKAGLDFVSNKL